MIESEASERARELPLRSMPTNLGRMFELQLSESVLFHCEFPEKLSEFEWLKTTISVSKQLKRMCGPN